MSRLYKQVGDVVVKLTPAAWNYGHFRAMFSQTLQFLIPRDYQIPARLGIGKLVAGRTYSGQNNGAWKDEMKSSHLKIETASTGKVPDV